jgi:hypothetical protein|tara:strand:- start:80 stop:670 length:591 start_codon:yes stop_codon:yes gene_type:complete
MVYDLEKKVNELHNTNSDINEHFPAIIKYGSECDHITEMGVRGICSTWAWLACNPKDGLFSYDLYDPSKWRGDLQSVIDTAKAYDIKFSFTEADVTKIEIESTDLLFIDTWHCYDQLKLELSIHSNKVKKYICFHDTTTYAHTNEPLTSDHNWEDNTTQGKGVWDAVTEFLLENDKVWELVERFENNNGFTVIKRK